MNESEFVVRIIQPAEKPRLPEVKLTPVPAPKKEKRWRQKLLNAAGFVVIAALGIVLALNFFNFGFSLREILVIIGMPLSVGIVASYAIL